MQTWHSSKNVTKFAHACLSSSIGKGADMYQLISCVKIVPWFEVFGSTRHDVLIALPHNNFFARKSMQAG